ncbi:MAG: DHA2 family efflux MFS transporter permease subunit [Verrucomicrobiales bacterium]|jgi:DHA2 family multidrug resistance protein|nr:DHA2 family efflux MFS transporter permease subunit [Verrucomicrobiales bacterium]
MSVPVSSSAGDHVSARTWLALGSSMLGAFLAVLNIQVTNASLNDIAGALGSSLDEASWVSTAYLVAEIIVIGASGWLCRVFSLKKYLLFSISLFTGASLLCALATNMNAMIVFRALQGLGGGSLIPICFNLIFILLPPARRATGMALFSLTAVMAPAVGPTVGGVLTDSHGWQWIFLIMIFPSVFMWWSIQVFLPADKPDYSLLQEGDYAGILCMAIGLGSLQFVLEEGQRKDWFGSFAITGFVIVSAVFLLAFIIIELACKRPFINLRLYRDRAFTSSSLVQFVLGFGLYGVIYLMPIYLSVIQRYNATDIGLTVMWIGMPQLFVIPFLPLLMRQMDSRLLCAAGLVLFGVSCLMNVPLTKDFAMHQLQITNIIRAIGQPLVMVPILTLATSRLPLAESGSASALLNMTRNLGGSCGIAFIATMLSRREQFHSAHLNESVSVFLPQTRDHLHVLAQNFSARGLDPLTAAQSALKALQLSIREQAWILSFSDNFYLVGALLLAGVAAIVFIPKPDGAPAAHPGGH